MASKLPKTLMAATLACALALPGVALASTGTASLIKTLLDDLSASELQDLQDEVAGRLASGGADSSSADKGSYGIWMRNYFTDDFGRQEESVSNAFVVTQKAIGGSFSNSATTNSACSFHVFVFPQGNAAPRVAIRMIEYGSSVVKSSYEDAKYTVRVLDKDGVVHEGTGKMLEGGDVMYVFLDDVEAAELLEQGGPVSFSIKESGKYATSSYLFTVDDPSGLAQALADIKAGR